MPRWAAGTPTISTGCGCKTASATPPEASKKATICRPSNPSSAASEHIHMIKPFPFFFLATLAIAQQPLFRIVDLNVGATEHVQLPNGASATVKLLSTAETRDKGRSAIRDARV